MHKHLLNQFTSFLIKRKKRFDNIISSYKREQTKVGRVVEYYLTKFKQFKEIEKEVTAPKLAKFVGRERTRVIHVLRELEKDELLEGKRMNKTGRPFCFNIAEKGEKLLNNLT